LARLGRRCATGSPRQPPGRGDRAAAWESKDPQGLQDSPDRAEPPACLVRRV
jgi:hypothetical protein